MFSQFISAGELLGPECKLRVITLGDDPHLPAGEYHFIDTYCSDKTCDCRKTMIQIGHNGRIVSIVNFGWEKPRFYVKWMGSAQEDELAKEMSGVSIDITSPDLVSPKGILRLVNQLMDEKWISVIKEHYRLIRKIPKPNNVIRLPAKITRNAPCPCGSGKKHKQCCL